MEIKKGNEIMKQSGSSTNNSNEIYNHNNYKTINTKLRQIIFTDQYGAQYFHR